MPNGNLIEQTCDLVMLIEGIKCGLPFKSTGLTALRNQFVIPLKQERITLADKRTIEPALFHVKARLGAKPDSNAWGSWLNPHPEEFFLYREPGGPSKEEIVSGFKQAQGYLQLTSDKLAALPKFEGIEGPPAPPPERETAPRAKMTITSGRREAPPRSDGPADNETRRGPPIDLEDDDRPPF
jgi:hypothetical protein